MNYNIMNLTQNRKRGRNLQEDEVEFMPLSKRINNLHINTNLLTKTSVTMAQWGPGPPGYTPAQIPESPPNSVQSVEWNVPEYLPDLNEHENPHYFNINKLLFEMYVQRLQRGCHVG